MTYARWYWSGEVQPAARTTQMREPLATLHRSEKPMILRVFCEGGAATRALAPRLPRRAGEEPVPQKTPFERGRVLQVARASIS